MVESYYLDKKVFNKLKQGETNLEKWKGRASEIGDYVATWGLIRFWAMSHSNLLKNGQLPDLNNFNKEQGQGRYFAWDVARKVLCEVIGDDFKIEQSMDTKQFQDKLDELSFNEQIVITELLIEISETIQFWTMRFDEINEINKMKSKSEQT